MAENDFEEDSLISQDDIDKLMESSPADEKEDEQQENVENEAEDPEDFSQEDIDALLDGMDFDSEESGDADDEDEEEDEDDLDLISQEDINRLMNSDGDESGEIPAAEEQTAGSQETEVPENPEPAEAPESREPAEAPDDWVIDESESVDMQESLMTGEQLDDLLAQKEDSEEAPTEPEEPVETDPEPETEVEAEAEAQAEAKEPEQQTETRAEEESGSTVVDLEDDDDLEDSMPDEEPDTAQEDIDALLMDTEDDDAEEDGWDGDDLISQQDIEALIMEAGDDEEDVGEDILSGADSDFDSDDQDSDPDSDTDTADEDESESEKIVLQEDDEAPAAEQETEKAGRQPGENKWYRSRMVVLAASILIVAGITISAGLFFLLSGESPEQPDTSSSQERVVRGIAPEEAEPQVDTVNIDLDESEPAGRPEQAPEPAVLRETIVMKDFVVLAPDRIEGLAYVRADLAIDYSGQDAYNDTRNNMPYFRDVVYSSILDAFESGKGESATESELLAVVKKALKRELSSSEIRGISFKNFKAG